ncbi:cytochrome [Achromobacter sp. MFA1 R4]|uniref:cytochrome n=1 Tax=Achromobacter sp. MFA1 R4 TaxID=1881016 RepID=UPI000953947C|nr:cytochrome [Achromobacter sp. MFA1 R4]SIT26299.1 Cytochrome P450 [Achromobacter sp. MFA1 R4]
MPPAHPLDAVTHPDPYPYYAALARDRPLYRDGALDLWVAAHPDSITAILRHPAARVRPLAEPVPRGLCPGPAADLFGRFVRMNDSAAHARLKALLAAFIQQQQRQGEDVHAPPAWLPAAPRDAAGIDRYLYAAPVHAQAALLGLAPSLHADCAHDIVMFLGAVHASARANTNAGARAEADAARIVAGQAAAARLQARLEAHLSGPLASPALRKLGADAAHAGIAPGMVAANLAGLLFQSCEAGAGLLGNALVMAGRRGPQAPATRRHALALIDEVLRRDPPLHNTRRFMAEPVEIDGQRIEAGQAVLLVLAAAAMAEPDAGWIFGAQRHACPGAVPARSHAADALLHVLGAGVDAAALAARFRYRPLPNARIPQFDFQEETRP